MSYFELAQDPLETQKEMMNYEIVTRKNEIEQDGKKLFSLLEKQDQPPKIAKLKWPLKKKAKRNKNLF